MVQPRTKPGLRPSRTGSRLGHAAAGLSFLQLCKCGWNSQGVLSLFVHVDWRVLKYAGAAIDYSRQEYKAVHVYYRFSGSDFNLTVLRQLRVKIWGHVWLCTVHVHATPHFGRGDAAQVFLGLREIPVPSALILQ